jgi:hypothetical protein
MNIYMKSSEKYDESKTVRGLVPSLIVDPVIVTLVELLVIDRLHVKYSLKEH